ncbi:hypothetical protein GLYMA_06G114466v4 [Glycine max]|nr:hypothetical protein GLYMA_06G114466v4 [Glycine max]KAH1125369.1 hypothetical protein GYH30_014789 [Glycine max]
MIILFLNLIITRLEIRCGVVVMQNYKDNKIASSDN